MAGKFIVVEGIDKSGKTTVALKVKEYLQKYKKSIHCMSFPERTTEIGKILDKFLAKKIKLPCETVHLLFSANRWEFAKEISEKRKDQIILCDRYYLSGLSYSLVNGLNEEWCEFSDKGLPKPDLTIFIDIKPTQVISRKGFGDEIYESSDYQKKVYEVLKINVLKCKEFMIIDGNLSIEEIVENISLSILNLK